MWEYVRRLLRTPSAGYVNMELKACLKIACGNKGNKSGGNHVWIRYSH